MRNMSKIKIFQDDWASGNFLGYKFIFRIDNFGRYKLNSMRLFFLVFSTILNNHFSVAPLIPILDQDCVLHPSQIVVYFRIKPRKTENGH